MPLPRYEAAKRATLVNAGADLLLAGFKIVVGYIGHSQALIADGIHSLADLMTDALVLIAAKIGGRTPDVEHPYGHQRIETIAAMLMAILIMIVGASIIYQAYQHIVQQAATAVHEIIVIVVALLAIGIKEGLYRYTLAIGKTIHSNLLITNAYHNRTDVWVSALVVISVVGNWLGVHYADNIGAAIIALIIIKSGIGLFNQGLRELIDTGVDTQTLSQIKTCIQSYPGVVSIHQLRTRSHGGKIFVDTHLIVNPFISVSEGHHIGERVNLKLIEEFPQIADVTVHIDPENDEVNKPSLDLPGRQELLQLLQDCWQNLPGFPAIEEINLHYLNGQMYIYVVWPLSALPIDAWSSITEVYFKAISHLAYIQEIKLLVRIK